ncbi:HAMP domain-containing protein, partial [uncultured Ruthenibacterium sp.]|uniref:HAMP domain-containing protein n=1 Tax=uncultured Ruthenibacterium sp. TaxID=1905347 RepID=UPI00349E8333
MKKRTSLRRTYYRAFFLLAVLPLLVAACVGLGFFYRMQISDAKATIELQQNTVSDTLRQEVQQASLQLAHFLLSPEGDALSLVRQIPETAGRRYEIQSDLDEMFGYYRLTGKRLAALHLYLKDGSAYELYTALAVPRQEVEQMDWYQKALENPEQVVVGAAAPDTLIHATNRQGDVLLTAAMSMGDEGGALETACLYFETDAEILMHEYDVQNPATRMFLVLNGQVLAGDQTYRDTAMKFLTDPDAAYGDMDWCITTPVANTGLCVLTLVDNHRLLAGVYGAGALLLFVFGVVLALYLAFSILFLKRILDPLNSLHDGMIRLQAGDFSHRLAPNGHRELRELME